MSKSILKKELQKLTKEQLIDQISELYDTYKPVKEYYQTFLNPGNIQELFEKYKAIIVHEFYPKTKSWNPKIRFSEWGRNNMQIAIQLVKYPTRAPSSGAANKV